MESLSQGAAGRDPDLKEPGALFAPGELLDAGAVVLRALSRQWSLAATVLIVFVTVTAAIAWAWPRSYHVEARIYALPTENAPGAIRATSDAPGGLAQGAAEVVVSQPRLLEQVRALDLLGRWESSRVPLLRILDRLRPPPSGDLAVRERIMAGLLRKQLKVQVKGPEVRVAVDWPEAQAAYQVVEEASQQLLAARREAELAPLERRVSSLMKSAAATQARIDAALISVDAARKVRRKGARAASVRGMQAEGHFGDLPDAELASQRMQLIASRKAIAEQEDVRRKHLSDLRVLYAEQKVTLGPENPALLDTSQKLAAVEREGAQLEAMKASEQRLLSEYVRAGGKEIELSSDFAASWPVELKEDDDAVSYGRARITMELSGLQQLLSAEVAAHAALAEARAAFDNRYAIITPAELPEKPASPDVVMLLLAGLVGGLLLSGMAAVAVEFRGGERWRLTPATPIPLAVNLP